LDIGALLHEALGRKRLVVKSRDEQRGHALSAVSSRKRLVVKSRDEQRGHALSAVSSRQSK
jgi:hypothetical protein